jgi:hypothetical protein
MVSLKSKGSYNTMLIYSLKEATEYLLMSIPSMSISPAEVSYSLSKRAAIVLLPPPEYPIIATD